MKCLGRACWLIFFFFFKIKILHLNFACDPKLSCQIPCIVCLISFKCFVYKRGFYPSVATITCNWVCCCGIADSWMNGCPSLSRLHSSSRKDLPRGNLVQDKLCVPRSWRRGEGGGISMHLVSGNEETLWLSLYLSPITSLKHYCYLTNLPSCQGTMNELPCKKNLLSAS